MTLCAAGDRAARPGGQEFVSRPGGDTNGGLHQDSAAVHDGNARHDQPSPVPK